MKCNRSVLYHFCKMKSNVYTNGQHTYNNNKRLKNKRAGRRPATKKTGQLPCALAMYCSATSLEARVGKMSMPSKNDKAILKHRFFQLMLKIHFFTEIMLVNHRYCFVKCCTSQSKAARYWTLCTDSTKINRPGRGITYVCTKQIFDG